MIITAQTDATGAAFLTWRPTTNTTVEGYTVQGEAARGRWHCVFSIDGQIFDEATCEGVTSSTLDAYRAGPGQAYEWLITQAFANSAIAIRIEGA